MRQSKRWITGYLRCYLEVLATRLAMLVRGSSNTGTADGKAEHNYLQC